MKLLFVCSENRLRSPTAEAIFSTYPDVEPLSAGISPEANRPVSADLIEWADTVVVMEPFHQEWLRNAFPLQFEDKTLVCLDIPDRFPFMDPELVELLKARVVQAIRL
ncbi:low molecular weight protein tyrosine phosphatase family protein [Marinobacter fonticola]|uniref:low molecular weight protein tyrosine phosphatase family protein n=1 Tax=Marinobacter fonticola TaxID=2603215 RepID=UPI0011E88A85|nr:phosphotyrosine protein phosphatase [Marinobacter fonticola]